ncbi:MAG TPA: hypothetical protein VGL53_22515 [Bryobacteraceae bacterium]
MSQHLEAFSGFRMSGFGRQFEEPRRFFPVLFDAVSKLVADAQMELSVRQTLVRGFAIPVDRGVEIGGAEEALLEQITQVILSHGVAHLSCLNDAISAFVVLILLE